MQRAKEKQKSPWYDYLILLCFAFFTLLFFTKSPPLFYLNDWVDSNAYFTVGKGIIHGLIPYRDLFEQKGPLLYFIHAGAYLIERKNFTGVYVFQSIGLFISLLFAYKTFTLYTTRKIALLMSLFLPPLLLITLFYRTGDSAEEFSTPFIFGLLYFTFKIIHSQTFHHGLSCYLYQGISLGAVFWMKYTLIGPWIGFFFFICCLLLIKKEFVLLLKITLISLCGFSLISIPILFYFYYHQAITDLIDVYFYFNIFYYPPTTHAFFSIIRSFVFTAGNIIKAPLILKLMLIVGLFSAFCTTVISKRLIDRLLLLTLFSFTFITAYWGGKNYLYYFLILLPFVIYAFIAALKTIKKRLINITFEITHRHLFIAIFVSMALTFMNNPLILESKIFPNNSTLVNNKQNISTETPQTIQHIFANIIKKSNNQTLLNYGFLDYGVYTAGDFLPNVRYFMKQNISNVIYPDIMDAQNKSIKLKTTQFVIVKTKHPLKEKDVGTALLHKNYQLVADYSDKKTETVHYWLFESKK